MSARRIPVHPATPVAAAERLTRALGCDLIVEDGRGHLVPAASAADEPRGAAATAPVPETAEEETP